jgi:ribosomal protein L23
VRIITVRAKSMRLGKTRGIKSGYKKAIVTVKEGQTIEVLPT